MLRYSAGDSRLAHSGTAEGVGALLPLSSDTKYIPTAKPAAHPAAASKMARAVTATFFPPFFPLNQFTNRKYQYRTQRKKTAHPKTPRTIFFWHVKFYENGQVLSSGYDSTFRIFLFLNNGGCQNNRNNAIINFCSTMFKVYLR